MTGDVAQSGNDETNWKFDDNFERVVQTQYVLSNDYLISIYLTKNLSVYGPPYSIASHGLLNFWTKNGQ